MDNKYNIPTAKEFAVIVERENLARRMRHDALRAEEEAEGARKVEVDLANKESWESESDLFVENLIPIIVRAMGCGSHKINLSFCFDDPSGSRVRKLGHLTLLKDSKQLLQNKFNEVFGAYGYHVYITSPEVSWVVL